MITITERVAAGVAFLDEHDPDWWRADNGRPIDLPALDLGSDSSCVLGQRCPLEVLHAYSLRRWGAAEDAEDGDRYVAYANKLSGLDGERLIGWAHERGFCLSGDRPGEGTWTDLTTEWKRLITERRTAVTR